MANNALLVCVEEIQEVGYNISDFIKLIKDTIESNEDIWFLNDADVLFISGLPHVMRPILQEQIVSLDCGLDLRLAMQVNKSEIHFNLQSGYDFVYVVCTTYTEVREYNVRATTMGKMLYPYNQGWDGFVYA